VQPRNLVVISPGGMVHQRDCYRPEVTFCGRDISPESARRSIACWQVLCLKCFPEDGDHSHEYARPPLLWHGLLCECHGSWRLVPCPTCGGWRVQNTAIIDEE
jgi:hypothetical protein